MKRKIIYIVGSKYSCRKLISVKLDKKIKNVMKELKNKSNTPKKITYLYASKVLGDKK